jgi:hypothetical protein
VKEKRRLKETEALRQRSMIKEDGPPTLVGVPLYSIALLPPFFFLEVDSSFPSVSLLSWIACAMASAREVLFAAMRVLETR